MPRASGCGTNHSLTRPEPIEFDGQDPGADEVEISILFCGIRHSDVHQAGDDRDNPIYPGIPRHGIVRRVSRTGASVTGLKPGNLVGFDCLIGSCSTCSSCRNSEEQSSESSNSQLATHDGPTKPLRLAATVPVSPPTRRCAAGEWGRGARRHHRLRRS